MNLHIFLFFSTHLALTLAHFQLRTPVAIGANDAEHQAEGTGPCGGFDITNRDTVNEWPVNGYPVFMITTHPKAVLEFRAALINDTTSWTLLIAPINQYGVGQFCEPSIPGVAAWVGQSAVVQVAQFAPDGINYQCAAVKFTDGPALVPASNACVNSTGNSADPAIGFTSSLPYGSIITPGGTSLPTGATSNNVSATTTSNTAASKTSSAAATSTSKASGAVSETKYQIRSAWWALILLILGVCAL